MNERIGSVAFLAVACAIGLSGTASAQSSLDDLIAKGAKRLTAAELKDTLSGAEISGPTAMGFELVWLLKTDGSILGTATYSTMPITGKWSVNGEAQFCFDHESSMGRDAACWDWYRLGSDYYATRGPSVMKRRVKKL